MCFSTHFIEGLVGLGIGLFLVSAVAAVIGFVLAYNATARH